MGSTPISVSEHHYRIRWPILGNHIWQSNASHGEDSEGSGGLEVQLRSTGTEVSGCLDDPDGPPEPVAQVRVLPGALFCCSQFRSRRDRLDPLGVVLLTGGVGALTAPLVLGQPEHWPIWTYPSFVFGSALVATFVWWEHRLGGRGRPSPAPLSLFEHRVSIAAS